MVPKPLWSSESSGNLKKCTILGSIPDVLHLIFGMAPGICLKQVRHTVEHYVYTAVEVSKGWLKGSVWIKDVFGWFTLYLIWISYQYLKMKKEKCGACTLNKFRFLASLENKLWQFWAQFPKWQQLTSWAASDSIKWKNLFCSPSHLTHLGYLLHPSPI